jgi:NAD-dependent dihydropyrimidine dehydrogenase PreA subunit
MKRDILKIDEELCNGCGLCVPNCQEGALQIIDGKARLVSEVLCDGLGACIGYCPEGAITIEKREAEPFSEIKVMEEKANKGKETQHLTNVEGGCPGSRTMVITRPDKEAGQTVSSNLTSELRQWPVQMHLINPDAHYFRGADLLLAADCIAFSTGNFHNGFLKGKSLAIACPKLDQGIDVYVSKLTAMIDTAKVNTITVMMMEVPCCGGLLQVVKTALARSMRKVPVKQIIISISGEVLKDEWI